MDNLLKSNLLIAVDGVDGSGKTTFIENFKKLVFERASRLERKVSFNKTSNLKDSQWSNIYRELNSTDKMNDSSKALIYYALLNQLIEEELASENDNFVMMDRSLLTPLVYHFQANTDFFYKHSLSNLCDPSLIILLLFPEDSYERWVERVDQESLDLLKRLKAKHFPFEDSLANFFYILNSTYREVAYNYGKETGNNVLFLNAEATLQENLENAWCYVYNEYYVKGLEIRL